MSAAVLIALCSNVGVKTITVVVLGGPWVCFHHLIWWQLKSMILVHRLVGK